MTVVALARDVGAIARLDLGEVLRSRWLVFCAGLYGALAAVFVLVAFRESTILGFTGMERVLTATCHALLLVLPLLALTATAQVVNQARADGAMELLFSHPFSRAGYYLGITAVRYLALVVPLVLLVGVLVAWARLGLGDAVPWGFAGRAIAIGAALLWAFTGIGLLISTVVRHPTRAQTWALVAYALGVALLDFALIGLMLEWRLRPEGVFLLAALNPVEAARMALLGAVEPELAVLGPVGFYLATRIGPSALLALGVGWPIVAGTLAWLVGFARFRREDLV